MVIEGGEGEIGRGGEDFCLIVGIYNLNAVQLNKQPMPKKRVCDCESDHLLLDRDLNPAMIRSLIPVIGEFGE